MAGLSLAILSVQVICIANRSHRFAQLLEEIDASQLEREYGGENDFKYTFEDCWDREDKLFPSVSYPDEAPEMEEN